MRLEKGNHFYVTETPDGLRFTAHNPEAEKQMCLGRRIMQKRRAQLRALATHSQALDRPQCIDAIHRMQLAEHVGSASLQDGSLLEPALATPETVAACGDPGVAALAASCGHKFCVTMYLSTAINARP